ncbi:hypothetical protein P3G55_03810 [Leptospira sp. 96542]|nr:hypothetical protein [Leptospira sp. 96542]
MERFSRFSRFFFVLALVLFVVSCSSSKTFQVVPEPVLDQQSVISDEVCLRSFVFFDRRPCVYFRAEKDNATGQIQYFLLYEIGNFDVDLPLGVSMKLGDSWYNLKKTNTDYSDTIVVTSAVSAEIIPKINESKQIIISYTNRKETLNYNLNASRVASLQSNLTKLFRAIESNPKLNIIKK